MSAGETAADRLYRKALSVRYDRHVGLWLPPMWHLALRRHGAAMIDLADWLSKDDRASDVGRRADPFSAAGLYYRAYRLGNARAAHNLAIRCFNRNDMAGYRQWLGRAAQAGDSDTRIELGRFETRRPHALARKIGRLRPSRKRDELTQG